MDETAKVLLSNNFGQFGPIKEAALTLIFTIFPETQREEARNKSSKFQFKLKSSREVVKFLPFKISPGRSRLHQEDGQKTARKQTQNL